jgi:hypothetical protein
MKNKTITILFLCLSLALILAACQTPSDHDIRGAWQYTLIANDGNVYDSGTITFSGSPARGTYLQLNIYEIEYDGEYQVSGANVSLSGSETWQGAFVDANQITGTWQHENGYSGTFSAVRP